jgi:hypothetical protein
LAVVQTGVGSFEQRVQGGRIVGLPSGHVEMERVTVTVAEQVDFCGETPTRTA